MPDRSAIDEFLTPEAMFTPGIAGAFTMMITNALGANFQTPRAWTALLLSFVFGLLVLVSNTQLLKKIVFYVLNSLVIFCVASGTNGFGVAQVAQRGSASISIVGSAFAQPADVAASGEKASSEQLLADYKKLTSDYNDLTAKIESAKTNTISKDDVIDLISQRDKIDQQRQAISATLLKRADLTAEQQKEIGGKSIFDKASETISGGANSVVQGMKGFFAPWKF